MAWTRSRATRAASRSAGASGSAALSGESRPEPVLRAQERALRQACRRNDPAAAELALCGIVRARWPGQRARPVEGHLRRVLRRPFEADEVVARLVPAPFLPLARAFSRI